MLSSDDLNTLLKSQEIHTKTYTHPPVYTVEESKQLRGNIPGAHCKNLFLKDRANKFWLIVALEHRRIDLKKLGVAVNARKSLSFATPESLKSVLGVQPGSVTPFAIINDCKNAVQVVLDEAMLGVSLLNYHPLRNDQTTSISPHDLVKFLENSHHKPILLKF